MFMQEPFLQGTATSSTVNLLLQTCPGSIPNYYELS